MDAGHVARESKRDSTMSAGPPGRRPWPKGTTVNVIENGSADHNRYGVPDGEGGCRDECGIPSAALEVGMSVGVCLEPKIWTE